ncbi:MAG: Gfo/Idh/MocA family oxidoreductase [Balneolaceae bacterium]
MSHSLDRKSFLASMALAGAGVTLTGNSAFAHRRQPDNDPVPVGIIGLDTSHSIAFTRLINSPQSGVPTGFKVVAAHPYGSRNLEASNSRIPGYVEQIREMGVDVVDSIDELLQRCEVILLETNDGHPRLDQATQVIEAGKRMFIDKPVSASLRDTIRIYQLAEEHGVPVWSSSSLRYMEVAQQVRHEGAAGEVLGAETYSPASLEPTHPDLFWYGIHGVEILYTLMGTGCQSVQRINTDGADVVTGLWAGDRIGTFRGIREGDAGYGGRVYGSEAILDLGDFGGYGPLLDHILDFFRTGEVPVSAEETIELYAFMEAADESTRQQGRAVSIAEVIANARS